MDKDMMNGSICCSDSKHFLSMSGNFHRRFNGSDPRILGGTAKVPIYKCCLMVYGL